MYQSNNNIEKVDNKSDKKIESKGVYKLSKEINPKFEEYIRYKNKYLNLKKQLAIKN